MREGASSRPGNGCVFSQRPIDLIDAQGLSINLEDLQSNSCAASKKVNDVQVGEDPSLMVPSEEELYKRVCNYFVRCKEYDCIDVARRSYRHLRPAERHSV